MHVEDAPSPGWYPDPEGGLRLRWWEGTDWSDRWRAPPTAGVLVIQERAAEDARSGFDDRRGNVNGGNVNVGSLNRQDSEAIVNQVRMAARSEAERAAGLFRHEARSVVRDVSPLISQYTNRVIRWVRSLSVLALILLVGWVAFQVFAQVSLFEWVGDRIDNLTDNTGVLLGPLRM